MKGNTERERKGRGIRHSIVVGQEGRDTREGKERERGIGKIVIKRSWDSYSDSGGGGKGGRE